MTIIAKARVAQLNGFSSITAAAELSAAFEDCFYRWKARLFGWWGSSSAQGVGGRVRTPAPMAYSEALSFFRRGALCAPAGGQRPPLRWKTDRERWLANSGADLEPHQLQFSTNPGPSGPAGIEGATQILRAGNFAWTCRYASPVMGSGADSPYQGEMARRARGGRDAVLWT